eukprot:7896209-Alexandrium_andersonii.AAC.1
MCHGRGAREQGGQYADQEHLFQSRSSPQKAAPRMHIHSPLPGFPDPRHSHPISMQGDGDALGQMVRLCSQRVLQVGFVVFLRLPETPDRLLPWAHDLRKVDFEAV